MTPAHGGLLRLAFLGQATFFRACSLHESSERFITRFFDWREGGDFSRVRPRLTAFDPDAVVVFRPETLPAGALADLDAPRLGFLTEPVVRAGGELHWDLVKRREDLQRLDPGNVDRLVAFDPLIVPTAEEVMPVWRAVPLPVADQLFGEPRPTVREPRLLFVGRSTVHREQWVMDIKYRHDLLHVAFGAQLEDLERLFPRFDVALNVHNEPYPSFENRVLLHLAAGHLVITEPLDPRHGLEPGRDLLEVSSPQAMLATVEQVVADPGAILEIRRSGRREAERVRASRVWPELVGELVGDAKPAAV